MVGERLKRIQAISELTSMIASLYLNHPVRVGIDGVDASGKTVLAHELVDSLQIMGRTVIRASVDDFHNPRKVRYQQGRDSSQGFYDDSFNYNAVISNVLEPLGPDGDLNYRTKYFDLMADSEIQSPLLKADSTAILVFEGIFLHRPKLKKYWDFSIFVHSDFDVILKRAQVRDLHIFNTEAKVREMYKKRYIPAQQIYLGNEIPSSLANVIWDNNDIENPHLTINKSLNNELPSSVKNHST